MYRDFIFFFFQIIYERKQHKYIKRKLHMMALMVIEIVKFRFDIKLYLLFLLDAVR